MTFVVGLILFCGGVYFSTVPWVTAAEVRTQLEQELPVGATKQQVSDWLMSKGYSKYPMGAGCCGSCDGSAGKRGAHLAQFSNYHFEFFFPTEIWITIGFDEQGLRTNDLNVHEFTYCF